MDKTEVPKPTAHLVVLKSPPTPYTETEQLRHAAFEPARNKPSNLSRPVPTVGDAGEEEDLPSKLQESGCKSSFVSNRHNFGKELVKVREGREMRRRPCGKRFSYAFCLRMVRFVSYISVVMAMIFPDSTRLRC